MDPGPMMHLVSVHDAFHARVIAARLGSDGILTEVRGAAEGPYPLLGEVRIYVGAGDEAVARQLLLADEVEAALSDGAAEADDAGRRAGERPAMGAGALVPPWLAVLAVVLVTCMWMARGL